MLPKLLMNGIRLEKVAPNQEQVDHQQDIPNKVKYRCKFMKCCGLINWLYFPRFQYFFIFLALKHQIFLCIIVFSSPAVVRILVWRLDSCFLTHIKKYMTPIHALIFEKHVKMCVYIRQIKSQCKLIILWRSTCTKKKLAGRSFFFKTQARRVQDA